MNKRTVILYGGNVELTFDPNSTKYRYTVNDRSANLTDASIRGVTSVLKDIISKPALMTWPMNMANAFYFGSRFDELAKEYVHDWAKAALKPDTSNSIEELHDIMMEGSRQWTQRSDQGKDIGTLVHSMVEAFLRREMGDAVDDPDTSEVPPKDLKMAQKAFKRFELWWNSLPDRRVVSLEQPVYSRQMKYAGTYDLLVDIGGRRYLLDLKTTNSSKEAPLGIYTENFLQLGAYAHAIMEADPMPIDDVGVVRLGKDGKLHIATAKDIGLTVEACERAFAFAVRVHDFLETAKPYLADVHFKSHLIPSNVVEQLDSVS